MFAALESRVPKYLRKICMHLAIHQRHPGLQRARIDLVTSPPQCYRSLQPFSALRLGGEGRADTGVDGCCMEDGRQDWLLPRG
jgi:hypothetical protein